MVFSSPFFLFLFLPIVLVGWVLVPKKLGNAFLFVASLVFYVWGEVGWAWVFLVSIVVNYSFGLWLEGARSKRAVLALGVASNLLILGIFKYGNFVVANLNQLAAAFALEPLRVKAIHLPIGISFFTFHAISYLVDVHRGRVTPQKNPVDFGLYIALFPQLVAGPIVRYHAISDQLAAHPSSVARFAHGARRFIIGLGKKVLIANTLAVPVDQIFALPAADLTGSVAWVAAILYALQIYFDFSAYSDMAIGLGHLFGFRLPENFSYPYVAQSMTEFWRRWHMSLSSWFRDYLYIPLGGNRRGGPRTYLNLLVVFLLCGLWHGASWTFVAWGLWHGAFLVVERRFSGLVLRLPRFLRHAYLLAAVVLGWVFFRADSFERAAVHLRAMFGMGAGRGDLVHPTLYLSTDVRIALLAAIVGSVPWLPWALEHRKRLFTRTEPLPKFTYATGEAVSHAVLAVILLASAALLASGTYNPFIYFRF
jgi:alginate O-acetyltransferase complex protein AlgI